MAKSIRIESDSWAIIERIIRRYPKKKIELQNYAEDVILATHPGTDSKKGNISSENKPQSITESKALKLSESAYYQNLKQQVAAVEYVYNNLSSEEKKKLMRIRYWTDPKRNIPYSRIDCAYSETQMRRIAREIIAQVGMSMGELGD